MSVTVAGVLGARCIRVLGNFATNLTTSTWTDGISAANATQTGSGLKPTAGTTTGGQTYPDFDGAASPNNDQLNMPAFTGLPTWSSAHSQIFGGAFRIDGVPGSGDGAFLWETPNSFQYVDVDKWNIGNATSNSPLADGTFHTVIAIRVGTVLTLYIDGVAQTATATGSTWGNDWKALGTTIIGARADGSDAYRFDGAMVDMFWGYDASNPFTTTDVASLHTALLEALNGPTVINGTLSVTLGALTTTATGAVKNTGALTATLGALTLLSNNNPPTSGYYFDGEFGRSIFNSTDPFQLEQSRHAAAAVTLDAVTLAAAGTVTSASSGASGTLSVTLDALTPAASATVKIQATASPTLAALTSTATGQVVVKGAVSATLADATLVSTGAVKVQAVLSATLADATVSSTGTVKVQAVAAVTLASATLASSGTVKVQGALAATLADLTTTSAGTVKAQATFGATLADLTLVATGGGTASSSGVLAVTLANITSVATGAVSVHGVVSATLGALTVVATATVPARGTVTATLGNATLAATGRVPSQGAVAATLADAALVAAGTVKVSGQANVALDGASLVATAVVPAKGVLGVTLDPLTVAAHGGNPQNVLAVTLADVTLVATGVVATVAGVPEGPYHLRDLTVGSQTVVHWEASAARELTPRDQVRVQFARAVVQTLTEKAQAA